MYETSTEVIGFIEKEYSQHYSRSGVSHLLNNLGFSYKKLELVSSKVDEEKQRAFIAKISKLLEDLKGNEAIYYADGVHPEHNTRATYAWCLKAKNGLSLVIQGENESIFTEDMEALDENSM